MLKMLFNSASKYFCCSKDTIYFRILHWRKYLHEMSVLVKVEMNGVDFLYYTTTPA